MFATDEAFFGSSEPGVSQDLVKQPANSKKIQRRKKLGTSKNFIAD